MTAHTLPFDGLSRALARPRRNRGVDVSTILTALALHGALWMTTVSWTSNRNQAALPVISAQTTTFIDVEPPMPKEEKSPPPEPEKAPAPTPRPAVVRVAKPDSAPAAPAPAQASAVLAAKEDPLAPADLTDTVVMGSAAAYAGGDTAVLGTSKGVVHAKGAAAAAAGSGAGAVPSKPTGPMGPDLSRRAQLAEGGTWSCPFPAEADDAQIDHAVVTLRIAIDGAGHPSDISVIRDPGAGFGREAKTCAMAKAYQPALDAGGAAIPGTATVNVRFDR